LKKKTQIFSSPGEFTGLIEQHGCSWKQFYLETELEQILEKFPLDFTIPEIEELKAVILAVRP
jgi:hypothetical protein